LAVDDETLDWDDLISGADKETGFDFISSDHTIDHYSEAHRPDMFNRIGRNNWETEGSKTLLQKAKEKYQKIMAAPDTFSLSDDRAAAVAKVLAVAHKALG
jgi:trimethylamine:corrinoid methyltransferase-like protein